MHQYVVFPALELVEFRAHAGAYVVGMPQPTAVAGLAHACARALASGDLPALNQCLYAVGQTMLGGYSRHMANEARSLDGTAIGPAKRVAPAPLVERVRSTMTISLVIGLELGRHLGPEEAQHAIEGQRLMGASLFVRRPPRVVMSLTEALRLLPAGHFVVSDASAKVRELVGEGLSTPDAIAELVARPLGEDIYKPHYVPVLSGYRLLELPQPRSGRRQGSVGHAYAEPVVGVALLRNRSSALRALRADPDAALLWRHTRQGDLCVLQGAPQVHDTSVDDL